MASPVSTGQPPRPGRRRAWFVFVVALSALGVVVLAVGGAFLATVLVASRPDPVFPSLAAAPDPALRGTVAYFDDDAMCVRVVAAAGQPSRDVLCIDDQQPADAASKGKYVGAHLAWLPDDRLEVTMFRMSGQPPDLVFRPDWQKRIDVRTGEVEDVPAGRIPATPTPVDRPTVDPDGNRVITSSQDGHVTVALEGPAGRRVLLEVEGNRDYGMDEAYWAPGFQWIVGNDGRLLVITPDEPPATRTLTDELMSFYGWDELAWFAVTEADLLAP